MVPGALLGVTRRRLALLGHWPVEAGHIEPSLVAPVAGLPSERLLDVALKAVAEARAVELDDLVARGYDDLPNVWPGEHYRLLTAIVSCLQPKVIVEIGTATGMSALAMKKTLPRDGKITTFDLLPWKGYTRGVLRDDDFDDGRLEQQLDDLSIPSGWSAHAELLRSAELIFVDAKHDGAQERDFLQGFDEVGLDKAPLVVFDDIRVWGMLGFWREIDRPKLDLTSFGHWSGTGLVDYGKSSGEPAL
jgi:predicted O-methyltransferase YrrM